MMHVQLIRRAVLVGYFLGLHCRCLGISDCSCIAGALTALTLKNIYIQEKKKKKKEFNLLRLGFYNEIKG